MSQYKRMISYVYQYIAGEKGQNIGFVRIEQRGGSLRIILQMRTIELSVMPEVWLFKQQSTGIEYIKAGKLSYHSGNLYFRIDTEAGSLCESGKSFDYMDGVIIYVSDREYYATSWTNDSIYIGEIVEFNKENKSEKVSDDKQGFQENLLQNGNQIEQEKEIQKEENDATDKIINKENEDLKISGNHIENKDEDVQMAEIKAADINRMKDEDMKCEEKKEEKNICDNCPYNSTNNEYGERMLNTFPVMYPFVSGKIIKSVRIEPKDIGCLPVNKWAFANNRFLLHGYYCYRHLIFVKLKDGRYAIGVPGVYSDKANNKASEYSFDDFQAIGTEKRCQGAFGYWISALER